MQIFEFDCFHFLQYYLSMYGVVIIGIIVICVLIVKVVGNRTRIDEKTEKYKQADYFKKLRAELLENRKILEQMRPGQIDYDKRGALSLTEVGEKEGGLSLSRGRSGQLGRPGTE